MYSLYLYFLGLSFRSTSKALEPFNENKRSDYVSIWNWVQQQQQQQQQQQFNPKIAYSRKTRVTAFLIEDETIFK
jgi:hypothetical protein